MADRKKLEPIDAFGTSGEQPATIYANIVPDTKHKETPINNEQQPAVIYAELAVTPPPVVNADNSA